METKNNKKTIAIIGVVLALAVALIAGVLVIQATPAGKVKRQIKLAEKYLTEMNYEQALIAYSEAIKIDPKCEQAYLAMADIYIKQGEAEKAVAILEEGQKNIQTDAMTEKLEEVKKKAASAGQTQQQTVETPTEAPTQATTEAPTETPTEVTTEEATEAPTEAQTQPTTTAPAKTGIQSAKVGDYITFGSYEQDGNTGNGAEPIEWLVLENQGDKLFVISRYGLDCQKYNATYTDVTWETCTLRIWLNTEFYNTAFNDSEKASVITTTVNNPDNSTYGTKGGNVTEDKVFCLSIDELHSYFASVDARATKPTSYAVSKGVVVDISSEVSTGNCDWWLQSPGIGQNMAAFVYDDIYVSGSMVDNDFLAVRPVLWIAVNP